METAFQNNVSEHSHEKLHLISSRAGKRCLAEAAALPVLLRVNAIVIIVPGVICEAGVRRSSARAQRTLWDRAALRAARGSAGGAAWRDFPCTLRLPIFGVRYPGGAL